MKSFVLDFSIQSQLFLVYKAGPQIGVTSCDYQPYPFGKVTIVKNLFHSLVNIILGNESDDNKMTLIYRRH